MSEPAGPVLDATVKFDKAMWNAWLKLQLRGKLKGHIHSNEVGAVRRLSDGTIYGVDLRGSFHVARDENGKKMRLPKARMRAKSVPSVPSAANAPEGDSRVAAPPPIGLPEPTSRVSESAEGAAMAPTP